MSVRPEKRKELPRVVNLRELGGYETADGRKVKRGLLWRSGQLTRLSQKDRRKLDAMGLKLVFDLRSTEETRKHPEYVPESAEYIHRSGMLILDEFERQTEGGLDMRSFVLEANRDEEKLLEMEKQLGSIYPSMARQPDAFRELFAALVRHAGSPVLFHCSMGKDRAGFSAALILTALGCDYETVRGDYLLSNSYVARQNLSTQLQTAVFIRNARVRAAVRTMLGVSGALLDSVFAEIDQLYGDFDRFRREALMVSDSDLEALRSALLA